MARGKKHTAEQVVSLLRQIEVAVASERTATNSRGEPTFINLDYAYPDQVFTVLVWKEDRKNVGELPREGSHVCASGMIQDYRGAPEIVVRNRGHFKSLK
jgi:hypothetical protein